MHLLLEVKLNSVELSCKSSIGSFAICSSLGHTVLELLKDVLASFLKFLNEVLLSVGVWHLIGPCESVSNPLLNLLLLIVADVPHLSEEEGSLSKKS